MHTMTQHSVPYASGVGLLNCDLLFSGLPRLPVEGEELYAQGFDMQLGGGLPATMIHLARLGCPWTSAPSWARGTFPPSSKATCGRAARPTATSTRAAGSRSPSPAY